MTEPARSLRDELENRLGRGAIPDDPKVLAEAQRTLRHQVINTAIDVAELAEQTIDLRREGAETRKLAIRALGKIDDVIGVAGNAHVDGGGALGRLTTLQTVQHAENQAALKEIGKAQQRIIAWLIVGLGAFSLSAIGWIIVLLHH